MNHYPLRLQYCSTSTAVPQGSLISHPTPSATKVVLQRRVARACRQLRVLHMLPGLAAGRRQLILELGLQVGRWPPVCLSGELQGLIRELADLYRLLVTASLACLGSVAALSWQALSHAGAPLGAQKREAHLSLQLQQCRYSCTSDNKAPLALVPTAEEGAHWSCRADICSRAHQHRIPGRVVKPPFTASFSSQTRTCFTVRLLSWSGVRRCARERGPATSRQRSITVFHQTAAA